MANPGSQPNLPLVERAEGSTLLSSWIVFVRESPEYLQHVLHGNRSSRPRLDTFRDASREVSLWLTLKHEAVHFVQGLTLGMPHQIGTTHHMATMEMLRLFASGQTADAVRLRTWSKAAREVRLLLTREIAGVSLVALLEAQAVTESLRAVFPEASTREFFAFLATFYGNDESSLYRRVIGRVQAELGSDAAYHLTPRLAAIAALGDRSPENFFTLLSAVRKVERRAPEKLSAYDLLAIGGMSPEQTFIARYDEIPSQARHPILHPFMDHLRTRSTLAEAIEFSCRPGDGLAAGGTHLEFDAPIVCAGNAGVFRGLAEQWPEAQKVATVLCSAAFGIWEWLVSHSEPYFACGHTLCPVHSTKACHRMVPPATHWNKCHLPGVLQQIQTTPDALVRLRQSVQEARAMSIEEPLIFQGSDLFFRTEVSERLVAHGLPPEAAAAAATQIAVAAEEPPPVPSPGVLELRVSRWVIRPADLPFFQILADGLVAGITHDPAAIIKGAATVAGAAFGVWRRRVPLSPSHVRILRTLETRGNLTTAELVAALEEEGAALPGPEVVRTLEELASMERGDRSGRETLVHRVDDRWRSCC